MLEFVGRSSPQQVSELRAHLQGLSEHLTEDVSNYAKGRQRFWLQAEWSLRDRKFLPGGVHDERLWTWCQRVFPGAQIGLVAYGPVGIKLHRDDSYADYEAMSINLGEIRAWHYNMQYTERTYGPQGPSDRQVYHPASGARWLFNCKNQHAAVEPAEDRWSINLWRIAPRYRDAFKEVMDK